ncbi:MULTISPECIES: NAD(P)/FAD-dependent oxidoreductase [Rhodopseudomonas]|uniref:2-polyprenyl-6-methoxyphenol hydroxylase n=1 Tax=Rhodopseudomonas palustris TaxID=1076 RepID=A0A0D7EJV0_RHOPL|nr:MULTISPECIES: NAD(P)/FAD-dependent oxidoreductase [Rhodopseudomonas]KIZ40795.1 2-polyprenyl-6-methoxyphenol hydroxylase [Rhodopseudomonas palustris]MDF3808893.1 NAD(P)/FAD-dependent oxidoreductase [Rhodopseudomonas sp. BAL398]WOK18521.1 NAD(P)/FAD-dependent oxidoreductase [Rhodopseudomonas sp. BAL398]
MRYTDIAIIGGGLAGSTAAAALGRAGVATIVIDPHKVYPPDFRCEKLGGDQIAILRRTGLAEPVLRATTHDGAVWIARFGRLIDKKPSDQYGILYDDLVATLRAEIPPEVVRIHAKATAIATSRDRQRITLSDGETISARLVVMANGLNKGLRRTIGIENRVISECHSVSLGFDLVPVGRAGFAFPALTYYPERASDRMAYLTLFPVGQAMRANLMLYRRLDDPWFGQMRESPEAALRGLMPRLTHITGDFKVAGPVHIRPADLYVAEGHRQPGVVLVGDAFCTSCPAGGTGTDKVFTDVERLCNVHIPAWLATPGMGVEKIAAFYDDPVKTAVDAWSTDKAFHLRALSTDLGPIWRARRWARFIARASRGALRRARHGVGGAGAAPDLATQPPRADHGRLA